MATHAAHSEVVIPAPAGDVRVGNHLPFMLFAGPCQMESRDHALEMATAIKEVTDALEIGCVANPRLPLSADGSVDCVGGDGPGDQDQKGPVPGPVGHEKCRGQSHGLWQSQCPSDGAGGELWI